MWEKILKIFLFSAFVIIMYAAFGYFGLFIALLGFFLEA